MRKILIFGNSGSGKTTLASKMSIDNAVPHLDLDVLAWKSPGVREDHINSLKEIRKFTGVNESWVIEGCYGLMIKELSAICTELHFLNPGIKSCIKNNISRPWESHKYESVEAQNENFERLQDWVRGYAIRTDEFSLSYHRKVFNNFTGYKKEYTS